MKTDQINQPGDADQIGSSDEIETGAKETKTSSQASKTTSAAPTKGVDISGNADAIADLMARLLSMPDVREERVENLRLAATDGENKHSAEEIAASLLQDEDKSPQ